MASRLLPARKLHYNFPVRPFSSSSPYLRFALSCAVLFLGWLAGFPVVAQQAAPAASGARILLLPRKVVSGERATLAVLDIGGRLTPGVDVVFSNGDKVTTDTTGRALFVAPLNATMIHANIAGRSGRVVSTVLTAAQAPSATMQVASAPRIASLSDRFEISGSGFCGDADSNHVLINGIPGLVLASSPASLVVLPPIDLDPGPAKVQISCGQRTSEVLTMVFVSLELDAHTAELAPGEKRDVIVHITGSSAKITLEAHNLAPAVAELVGGTTVRALSSGGAENEARFRLSGKQHGTFMISIRLLSPLVPPKE